MVRCVVYVWLTYPASLLSSTYTYTQTSSKSSPSSHSDHIPCLHCCCCCRRSPRTRIKEQFNGMENIIGTTTLLPRESPAQHIYTSICDEASRQEWLLRVPVLVIALPMSSSLTGDDAFSGSHVLIWIAHKLDHIHNELPSSRSVTAAVFLLLLRAREYYSNQNERTSKRAEQTIAPIRSPSVT